MAGRIGTPGGPAPAGEPAAARPAQAARDRLNLIEQITADAVASDYSDVGSGPDSGSRRQRVLVAALGLALAGFVLAVGVSARLLNAPVVDEQRLALRDRVEAEDAQRVELVATTAELADEVEAARAAELERTGEGAALAADIADLELTTGYAAVRGPGVVVVLEDAPIAEGAEPDDLEQVLDSDVQRAVNGLWSAGAEAVSVNGSRLTAQSAIRSAAGAILVNYRPLQPPYRVEAIGPERMLEGFRSSQDAAELAAVSREFGIGFSVEPVAELLLAAAAAALPDVSEATEPGEGEGP